MPCGLIKASREQKHSVIQITATKTDFIWYVFITIWLFKPSGGENSHRMVHTSERKTNKNKINVIQFPFNHHTAFGNVKNRICPGAERATTIRHPPARRHLAAERGGPVEPSQWLTLRLRWQQQTHQQTVTPEEITLASNYSGLYHIFNFCSEPADSRSQHVYILLLQLVQRRCKVLVLY